MSRITGNLDALSQLKDQYTIRERENDQRHRDEVREIKELHKSEIDKLKGEAQRQIEDMQSENNERLNQRDLQFQKEIEALKALYAKRFREEKKVD